VEQKKFVREQYSAANSLADAGQVRQAVALLESALQRAPGNTELESLRVTFLDRLATEEAGQLRQQAVETALAEGDRILQERGASEATQFFADRAAAFSDSPQFRERYDYVREREALEALDRRLTDEPNPARQIQLAEETLRHNPNSRWIQQRVAGLYQLRDQLNAVIERAQGLEAEGRLPEAMQQWQQLSKSYPQVLEFEAQVKRVASLQAEREKSRIAPPVPAPPVVPAAAPEPSKPGKSSVDLSATRVLDSAALQHAEVRPGKSTQVIGATATAPRGRKAVPSLKAGAVLQKRSVLEVKHQMANLFAGPNKYVAIAVAAIVLAAVSYLLVGGHKKTSSGIPAAHVEVHIITNPPDAVVTSGSKPVVNGTVSFPTGTSVTVEVARLGYKPKQVEVRQEPDGKITLEPEPLHLSIQTSEKSGTVELDGTKIGDLADGNLENDLVPDGNAHQLNVTAKGKRLFTVELQVAPGAVPQVKAFDANGLFLITSLGSNAKVYAGNFLKNVRLGDQSVAVSPSGADLGLSEGNSELRFGEGGEQGSLTIEMSNAPTLAVHAINTDGQVLVTSNVEGATLTVDGTAVRRQRRGWQVSRPPGTYNFALSAEGYEPQMWTIALQRSQSLTRKVDLQAKVKQATMASLSITGGTPGAEVEIDGRRAGELDVNGSLQLPKALADGKHSLVLAKPYHDSRTFEVSARLPAEVRLPDAKLTPWPTVTFESTVANVTVKYRRAGEPQEHQASASVKLRLPSGQYTFVVEEPGFETSSTEKLVSGDDVRIPLKLVPIPDYAFQDPVQLSHDGPWIRLKDPHKFAYLKSGFLNENLIFAKPGKNLFWNKKVEWVIEAPEGSARVQYALEGQKLVRKFVIKEEASDQKEAKADATATTQATSLSVHIQVDGSHVQISNDKGVVLDDYTAQHNFSGGRIGIRTESQFIARAK